MAANLPELSGGQLVVASLRAHGVEMAFSVAGESYLEVLDALYDAPEIRLVTCRQEGGAAFMAEAYGKLTGKPGVLLVTRGPGACNAVDRRPHRAPGFDADGRAGRPGRAPPDRPRGVSGSRFPQDVRAARQMGDADRHGRARPRIAEPGVSGRDLGPPRPGGRRAARGHAARARRRRRRRSLPRRAGASRRRRPRRDAPPARSPPRGRSCWSAAAAGTDRACADIAAFRDGERSAGVLLVPPPGYRRQHAAVLCRRSRHRRRARRWSRASNPPIWCSRSAPGSARSRRNPTR